MAFEGLSNEQKDAPAVAAQASAPTGITALNADDAKAFIAALTTKELLALAGAEEQNHPKFPGGRISVMRAIEERGTALFNEADEAAELARLEKLAGVEERRAAEQAGGEKG